MSRYQTRWAALFLLLGAAGLWTFLCYYDRAMPLASLDFKLSRTEILAKADEYVRSMGHDPGPFEKAQIFAPDRMSQIFLQKTLGLDELNRLARDWVSLWKWRVRWYKPLAKEEFHVHLDPGGRVVHFQHLVLDTQAGASLDSKAARSIAEEYFRRKQRLDMGNWALIEQSTQERTARVDHTFTYRKSGFTVGDDGHYRIQVVVQGDAIGSYWEHVKVPQSFRRQYDEVRSRADLLTHFFSLFWLALGIAALIILARQYRTGGLIWRTSALLGLAVMCSTLIAQLNMIPLTSYNFDTSDSNASFLAMTIIGAVFGSLLMGGAVMVAGSAGGALCREELGSSAYYPELTLDGLLRGRFVQATLIGYGTAGAMLGFLVIFYMAGERLFGIWSPAYLIEYDNAFSTLLPWAYPLLVGLVAAAQEELFFRALAIPLVLRLTRQRWLAVILPAVVWGFLHSNYPVEPIYTRGIELTIVGCAFGVIFLRWGFWATFTAHYVYNAFVTALPMMISSSSYFQISGVVVVSLLSLPLLFALVGALRGRRKKVCVDPPAPEAASGPAAPPVAHPPDVPPPPDLEEPLLPGSAISPKLRLAMVLVCAAAILMITVTDIPNFGEDSFKLAVDRSAAMDRTDEIRGAIGWKLPGAKRSASFHDLLDSKHFSYLINKVGVQHADSLVDQWTAARRWNVRWFKEKEEEEFTIGVDQRGAFRYLHRTLPEGKPGASLSKDAARQVALRFMREHFSMDLADASGYGLREHHSYKRISRLDHSFIWEKLDQKVADAQLRVSVKVQGDEVGGVWFSCLAPEPYLRGRNERTLAKTVLPALWMLLALATLVLAVVAFFRLYRARGVDWALPWRVGLITASCFAIERINNLPLLHHEYMTNQAMMTYLASQAISTCAALLGILFASSILTALAIMLWRDPARPSIRFGEWTSRLRAEITGVLLIDSVLLGVTLVSLMRAFGKLRALIKHTWFPHMITAKEYSPDHLDSLVPAISAVSKVAPMITILLAGICGLLLWKRTLRGWRPVKVLFVLFFAAGSLQTESTAFDLIIAPIAILQGVVMVFLAARIIGRNLLAYSFFILVILFDGGVILLETSVAYYQANGLMLILVALTPLVVGAWLANRDRGRANRAGTSQPGRAGKDD